MTMVALISTWSRLAITFWNRGADTRLIPTEVSTPASTPRTRLFPVAPSTSHVTYMENTTTWG